MEVEMSFQNVTLSISEDILAKIKVIAARRGTSISGLLIQVLEEIVAREEGYQAARQKHLSLLEDEITLDTKGILSWTRDNLHER
jgi:hypothetical protein